MTSLRITRTGSFHCFSIPLHYVYRARFRIKNFMEYRKIRGRTTKSAYKTFTARTKWEKVEDERIFVYAKTARRYACARPRSLLHAALRHARCLGSFSRSNPSFIQGPIHFDRGTRPPRIDRHACARAPVTVERTSARTDYTPTIRS